MLTRLPDNRNLNRLTAFGTAAFLLTVVISFAGLLFGNARSTTNILVLLALGALFIFSGLVWYGRIETKSGSALLVRPGTYCAAQLVLGGLICWLGTRMAVETIWLIMMPLISHAYSIMSNRRAALVAAGVFALFIAILAEVTGSATSTLQSALSFAPGVFFVAVFSMIAMEQSRARARIEQLAGELHDANQRLSEYSTQVEELATTRERNRLAREVHDSLGHYLTAVNIQLEAARAVLVRDPAKAAEALVRAQTLTKDGLSEVRRSVAALRQGPMDSKSLRQALEGLVEASRTGGAATTLVVEGTVRPLVPQIELTLYRAVQEALTNCRKHANPSRIDVTLRYSAADVTVIVQNDGSPAQPDADTDGFGLLGLRERAQLLGGTLLIDHSGDAFELALRLPDPL